MNDRPTGKPRRPSSAPVDHGDGQRLRELLTLTRRLSDPLPLSEAMPTIVQEVLHALDMDRGAILLDQGADGFETVVACRRDQQPYTAGDEKATKSLFQEVKQTRRPVMTFQVGTNAPDDSSFWSLASLVGLPLLDRSRFLGVLCVDSESRRVVLEGEYLAFAEAVASVAALALTNARAHTRMLEAALLSEDFGTVLDIKHVLDKALRRIVQLTRSEQGFLLIRNAHSGELEVWRGMDRQGRPLSETGQLFLSKKVVTTVAETGEAMLSDNVAAMSEFDDEDGSVVQFGLTSILCVPIRSRKQTLGVVYLENRLLQGVFSEEDKRLVQLVADRAGMAIENAKLYQQEREILRALANAVEARDAGTSSHVQRVSQHAVAVGRKLGLSEELLVQLEQSALLHDIGKIGIPDRVLLKQGALDEEEWRMMRSHPQLGLAIVGPVALPKAVRDGILYHQEAYDGSGYPFGIRGDVIPLFGRIIAVVDAYDAMVADRPYRKARSPEEAMVELDVCAGTKFDPEVVIAFLEVLHSEHPPSLRVPPV